MTNVITTFGFTQRLARAVKVETAGYLYNSGWTSLLRIPASTFVANHTYMLVVTGLMGDFRGCWKAIPEMLFRAELGFREGAGTYWGNVGQWLDPMTPALEYGPGGPFNEYDWSGRGFPFQIMVQHAPGANPQDLHLVGRFFFDQALRLGVDIRFAGFTVDQLLVTAWDLTVLASSPLSSYFKQSWATTDWNGGELFPGFPPTAKLTQSGIPGGAWMAYWSLMAAPAAVAPGDGPVGQFATNGTPTYPWAGHLRVHFGQSVNPNVLVDRIWLGQQGILSYGSTWEGQVQIGDDTSPKGRLYRAELLLVELSTEMAPFLRACSPSGGSRFYDQEFEGSWDFHRQAFTTDYTKRAVFVFSTRASGQVAVANVLEVDSGELIRPTLGVIAPRTRATSPETLCGLPQVYGGELELGKGRHSFLARGLVPERDYGLIASAGNLDATDLAVFGFCMEHHSEPPVQTYETPGAAVAVNPARETGLDVGALPALPSEPSFSLNLQVKPEIRSIEFPSGYKVTSPKFIKMRRIYQLRWAGLSTAEGDALFAFFQTLIADGGGAFRWAPPGALAESAWALDPYAFARDGSSGLEATALELVFTAEP